MTITIGIDPHKASHTAVAIDNTERVLDEFRSLKRQISNVVYRALIADARRLGQ